MEYFDKPIMAPVFLLLLLQMHIYICSSTNPLSGGMYDLSAIADALRKDVNVPSTVGTYDVRLPEGSSFYIDSTGSAANTDIITFTVEIRHWKNSVMIDGEKLFLCRPFDVTYDSCPLTSKAGVTTQELEKDSINYFDMRTWTFSLDLSFIRRYVFIDKAAQTQQSKNTLIVSGRLNPLYYKNLAKDEKLLRRPLPIVPIYIHNKYVMNLYGDERNLLVCQNTPSSYVKLESDQQFCKNEHALKATSTIKNTQINHGKLLVYTPNEHGIPVTGTICFIETYTRHTTCGGFFHKTTSYTKIKRHAVSYDLCKLWQITKQCTSNNARMMNIFSTKSKYRSYLHLGMERKDKTLRHGFCFHRGFHLSIISDCVMDLVSPMTYQFPFTHVDSALGPISPSIFSKQNYWISENKTEILVWNNTDQLLGRICPFTLLKVITTKAIHTHNLHMSHALRLGTDESVRSMTVFLGGSTENTYRVNNKQQIDLKQLKKLNMGKCADMTNTCDTYITEDSILLQFCNNSLTVNSYMTSSNIYHKSPLPPDITGPGVHVIPTNTTAFSHPLEDIVCHGFHELYTDKLSHQWKCKNGYPTLTSPIANSPSTESNILKTDKEKNEAKRNVIHKRPGADRKIPLPNDFGYEFLTKYPDVGMQWVVQQLQQIMEKECETRSVLQKIAERVSFLSPALARQFIHTHNPVYVSKSGHHYGLHRCETINWRNVEMMPSLLTDHASIREYNTDARVGLCYTHPVIKIVSPQYNFPMVGQLMPNNRVSHSLSHVEKCQNDRKKIFSLGDTLYVFSQDNNLESTQPAHHYTVAHQLLSEHNKINKVETTIPNTISTLRPEIASSAKNKIFRRHVSQISDHISQGQSKYVPEFADGDIATTVSRLDSTLARVNSLVNPNYVDMAKEQEQILQTNDLLNLPKSFRTTSNKLPPDTSDLKHVTSWLVQEAKIRGKHFQTLREGFSTFISFCVVPILIIVVIINWVELRTFRTGPVNASSGAAIGQIDKMGNRTVHDKILKDKIMFIPRDTNYDGWSDDESNIPKLLQK